MRVLKILILALNKFTQNKIFFRPNFFGIFEKKSNKKTIFRQVKAPLLLTLQRPLLLLKIWEKYKKSWVFAVLRNFWQLGDCPHEDGVYSLGFRIIAVDRWMAL